MSKILTPFPYYGGKSMFIDFINDHIPRGHTLIDMFGGSGVVAFNIGVKYKKVIYNDINSRIYNFFKVLREQPEKLLELMELTLASREDYENCKFKSNDPVEDARRVYIRIRQSFNNKGLIDDLKIPWRCPNLKSLCAARSHSHSISNIESIAKRIRAYNVENLDWRELLDKYDIEGSVIFADPPYDLDVRIGKGYSFEFSRNDHIELQDSLTKCKSMAVVCGYHSELYDDLYSDWLLVEKKVTTHAGSLSSESNKSRVECLWLKQHPSQSGDLI